MTPNRPVRTTLLTAIMACLAAAALGGCQAPARPDYNRPLPPGTWALRLLLDPARWPDLQRCWQSRDVELAAALRRSAQWFEKPSARDFFPIGDVGWQRARVSIHAFAAIAEKSTGARDFEDAVRDNFNCYTSVGYDDRGSVLYTGYYTPTFRAALKPTDRFRFPLYRRPADLATDPVRGTVLGRKVGSGYAPYPARAEIEDSGMLAGLELVYLGSRLDQYLIQVNGSARLHLPGGDMLYVGYAGSNGRPYTGLGQTLIDEGVLRPEQVGMTSIRRHFYNRPQLLDQYIRRNERYVFFTEYDGSDWPAGSLGFRVGPLRSLATDKQVFPRGGVVVVDTAMTPPDGVRYRMTRLMLDQDTGGAIRAAGRADIYYGIGPAAAELAGHQFAEGRLYYFFLKPERVAAWQQRLGGSGR